MKSDNEIRSRLLELKTDLALFDYALQHKLEVTEKVFTIVAKNTCKKQIEALEWVLKP